MTPHEPTRPSDRRHRYSRAFHRKSTTYQSPPRPPSQRLPLVASGQQHDYDDEFFNEEGYTLEVPLFGPQKGVHLTVPSRSVMRRPSYRRVHERCVALYVGQDVS